MSAMGQKQTFRLFIAMSALPPKADIVTQSRNARFVPKADIGVFSINLYPGRLQNRLFASNAQILKMVFQASLDTTAPSLNIRATLFDVRFTSLTDGSRLYQRKLAAQRKVFPPRLYARGTALTRLVARALSGYVGSAGCNDVVLRKHRGWDRGNCEKRQSHDSGE